ncbi:Ig-like domain repeat protein [uncultured Methanobrevibacter sp.]|mgnify:CR=1 FL=1|uniref:Ig-like domain repeat protein n=1 Tax=uncultured Methanobrevibacter sp. TaxID=253161 RepID=UPI002635C27B|nr:Ig-like domain repeat protein [uncultured Methanobrevibacter sp.]
MVKCVNKSIILFLVFLLLLLIVPSTFASDSVDNQTIISNEGIQFSNIGNDDVIDDSNNYAVYTSNNPGDILTGSNDIYFNASAASDGKGTQSNPYKYLYYNRLSAGCTAHFADGVYELDDKKGVYSSMTIVGESAQNTIIKFNGIAFTVGSSYTLTLKDITLNHATVKNYGTVGATNVIFKNGVAADDETGTYGYNNAYGGAIYNYAALDYAGTYYTNSPKCTLYNCTFMNNSAMYGGAIYLPYGEATISNCKFINNSAHWFGGAIAAEDESSISITDSTFENCRSIDDAGGAIYAKSTDLEIKNSNIVNCSANFAGAICSLNSDLIISNSNFMNNLARYEGGAVYKMYGSGTITKSNFTKNVALNGGALFTDNCTKFNIRDSEFESNAATGFGGAIFSNANLKLSIDNVIFSDNKASYNSNILNQSNFSPIVSSSNDYPLFVYKSEFNGTLPARYNLAEEGYVTPIEDQQSSGNCWAFAALASLESCVLKASNKTFVFSVENMKNLIEMYSSYGWTMETNNGGYNTMPMGYLTSWLGPVNATLDPFDDMGTLSPVLESEIHVQNIHVLSARTSYTDNNAIKEAILKYGAVYISYYHSASYLRGSSYYYPYVSGGNHAVTVVGWDDNYSRYNFATTPAGDGAFIVKNSWGSSWGDKGYFYISYYDKSAYRVGATNQAFTYILNDTVRYNKNYQYDIAGMTDYLVTGKNTIWYQNIFNATGNEAIAAISTYFNSTVDYEISIYVNDKLQLTQSGTHENMGYYTIPLKEVVPVSIGDIFKVVIKLTNPREGYALVPISEQSSTTRCYYSPGISYFSHDGVKWIDLYDYTFSGYDHQYSSQVACIKAFTINDKQNTTITLNNITTKVNEITEIIATVLDDRGKLAKLGEVIFTIDGKNYTANVVNGVAKINVTFDKIEDYVVSAIYKNNSLYNESTTQSIVSVTKNDVNLTIDVADIIYGENVIVNINLISANGNGITDTVILRINNKDYYVEVINGSTTFVVPDLLTVGQYQIIASYLGTNQYNPSNIITNFTVDKKEIGMNVTIDKDYRDVTVNVNLSENISGNLTILLNNTRYTLTYVNGTGSYTFKNLTYGNYTINVIFTKDNYEPMNISQNIEINSIKTIFNADSIIMYYHDGTKFVVVLKDIYGNPLANMSVIISINGMNYIRVTDENGSASMAINLVHGKYNVTTTFNGTSKYFGTSINSTVDVLSTIITKNIIKYYRNGTQFYATVLDENGNPLANVTVTFNINGVFYNRTTNENGTAKLNINLHSGSYIITTFNPITGEQIGNNVTVLSKITEAHDLVKYYKNDSKFSVKILDNQGYPISGTLVTFNINGVFYYRETDENGIASLAINLRPGNYIITTMYGQYALGNNVTVLPTLETSDLEMKYHDGSKFNAKVVDGNGNPLANKTVTFNVNGVFYHRDTDENGIAALSINLIKGEYIITSMYDGFETGNTIKIQ